MFRFFIVSLSDKRDKDVFFSQMYFESRTEMLLYTVAPPSNTNKENETGFSITDLNVP